MTIASLALALLLTTGTDAGAGPDRSPILLDFTATWCGPCQAMKPAVEQLSAKGYPIKAVDIDRFPELAERYGVRNVPTFVLIDRDGREISRRSGACAAADLASFYRQGLATLASTAGADPQPKAVLRGQDPEEPATEETADPGPTRNAYKPWETVVRIKVYNHLSRPRASIGFGSGTIIHSTAEESIILTCAHIFKIEEMGGRQPSPGRFPLKVYVDLFDGRLRPSATEHKTPYMMPAETDIAAEVIDYDYAGDVGLIRIRPGRPLPYSKVVKPGWTPQRNMKLTTLGCSEGRPATAWSTHVTNPQIQFKTDSGPYVGTECANPPLQGRSGGGLFTLDGLLAGVCDFNDGPRGQHGLYASPTTIHRFLNKNQLQICWNVEAPAPRPDRALLAQNDRDRATAPEAPKVRAQSPANADGQPLTIPLPEILNIRPPEGVIAEEDSDSAEGSTRRFRWQPVPAGRLDRVQLVGVEDFDAPDDTRPRTARHQVEHAADDSDLFLAAPGPKDWEAISTRPDPEGTSGDRRGRWSPASPPVSQARR